MNSVLFLSLIIIATLSNSFVHVKAGVPVREVVALLTQDGTHSLIYEGILYVPSVDQTALIEESENDVVSGGLLDCVQEVAMFTTDFWIYVCVSVGLIAFGGLMSGLTVGLFSIDPLKLELIMRENSSSEKSESRIQAERVQPILSQHHRLLVTLLLSNAAAMEALPVFLNVLVPDWLAILLSVTFVLIFGEVLPQALCTKDPLKIGARFAFVVRSLMFLLSPIAIPIACILDLVLGHNESKSFLFKRSELKSLLDLHAQHCSSPTHRQLRHGSKKNGEKDKYRKLYDKTGKEGHLLSHDPLEQSLLHPESYSEGDDDDRRISEAVGLTLDEAVIMKGALDLNRKNARDALTPSSVVYTIEYDSNLDFQLMSQIMATGFSRIPVVEGSIHHIKGVLLANQLINVSPEEKRSLQDIPLRTPLFVSPRVPLMDMLNEFQNGRTHIAFVTEHVAEYYKCVNELGQPEKLPADANIIGIITIEDVLEELLQEEIWDEGDIHDGSYKSQLFRSGAKKLHADPVLAPTPQLPQGMNGQHSDKSRYVANNTLVSDLIHLRAPSEGGESLVTGRSPVEKLKQIVQREHEKRRCRIPSKNTSNQASSDIYVRVDEKEQ